MNPDDASLISFDISRSVYKNSYWAQYYSNKINNAKLFTPEIISNRKNFADRYNLKRADKIPEYIEKIFSNLNSRMIDHKEIYKTDKDYICIISPYGNYDSYEENDKKDVMNAGFQFTEKLYSTDSFTMFKIVKIKKYRN